MQYLYNFVYSVLLAFVLYTIQIKIITKYKSLNGVCIKNTIFEKK